MSYELDVLMDECFAAHDSGDYEAAKKHIDTVGANRGEGSHLTSPPPPPPPPPLRISFQSYALTKEPDFLNPDSVTYKSGAVT